MFGESVFVNQSSDIFLCVSLDSGVWINVIIFNDTYTVCSYALEKKEREDVRQLLLIS